MGLQRIEVEVDEDVGVTVGEIVRAKTRARHQCGVVGVGQPMGFLDRVGVDSGKRLGRHVDEGGDLFLHECGAGEVVNPLKPLAQFGLGLGQIGPHLA